MEIKLHSTSSDIMQHGGQTNATCWIQQCWMMLHQHVGSVWLGLLGFFPIFFHHEFPIFLFFWTNILLDKLLFKKSLLQKSLQFKTLCCSRKISILPSQKGLEFHGGGGSTRPKNVQCMKLNWNFQRGGEMLEKNPFCACWEGMDIFYTIRRFEHWKYFAFQSV